MDDYASVKVVQPSTQAQVVTKAQCDTMREIIGQRDNMTENKGQHDAMRVSMGQYDNMTENKGEHDAMRERL